MKRHYGKSTKHKKKKHGIRTLRNYFDIIVIIVTIVVILLLLYTIILYNLHSFDNQFDTNALNVDTLQALTSQSPMKQKMNIVLAKKYSNELLRASTLKVSYY